MAQNDLYTRAMLVGLRISAWSARKYDRKLSQEVAQTHGATLDAGRYNKHLLPGDAPSYKALCSHISALRTDHAAQTLAWSDDGWRLLPVANYQKYTDTLRAGQHEFNRLLSEFAQAYPALRAEAKQRLNGMYSDTDYPSDVTGKYSFAIEYAPVPVGTDFRLTLSQEEIDIIASKTEARVQAAFDAAQTDAVNRLYEVLAKIHERLSTVDTCSNCDGKGTATETRKNDRNGQTVQCWICDGKGQTQATFRDSLVSNAREVCDALTRLNIKGDSRLESFRAQTEKIAQHDPQTLRDDVLVRVDTAKRADDLLREMQATYGTVIA